jgi:hypothetical protein
METVAEPLSLAASKIESFDHWLRTGEIGHDRVPWPI